MSVFMSFMYLLNLNGRCKIEQKIININGYECVLFSPEDFIAALLLVSFIKKLHLHKSALEREKKRGHQYSLITLQFERNFFLFPPLIKIFSDKKGAFTSKANSNYQLWFFSEVICGILSSRVYPCMNVATEINKP